MLNTSMDEEANVRKALKELKEISKSFGKYESTFRSMGRKIKELSKYTSEIPPTKLKYTANLVKKLTDQYLSLGSKISKEKNLQVRQSLLQSYTGLGDLINKIYSNVGHNLKEVSVKSIKHSGAEQLSEILYKEGENLINYKRRIKDYIGNLEKQIKKYEKESKE